MLAFPAQRSTEYKPADKTSEKPQENNMRTDSKAHPHPKERVHLVPLDLEFPTKVLSPLRENPDVSGNLLAVTSDRKEVEMC